MLRWSRVYRRYGRQPLPRTQTGKDGVKLSILEGEFRDGIPYVGPWKDLRVCLDSWTVVGGVSRADAILAVLRGWLQRCVYRQRQRRQRAINSRRSDSRSS